MFIIANFIEAVARILDIALTVYMWIVIISALITWINPDPYNPIVRFLRGATEPVYRKIRKFIPTYFGGIDIAPLVVIAVIIFLQYFLVNSLHELAVRLRY
ncbi:MAG TPA: YggT family protein [Persephonella sp.]|uniref:Yggt family protein n=1 Tax=Persephonella marina (strain DSM 14350 / EX-H1) TaxID=123214 RepID=C0QQQ3_PERMH|nr:MULTISPECIES: YggT family protein [Persephonella]ACO03159.1 yggt family protein [Persephonella marina EX-H1]HCB68750.1 YggT family protein [Persephonella sp.]